MSQETKQKSAIPANRSFQATNISSFTEARRQRFLSYRKQNRELYFEKARKIALNADKQSDYESDQSDPAQFDFSFNRILFHKDYEKDHPQHSSPTNNHLSNDANNDNSQQQNVSNGTKSKSKSKKKKRQNNAKHLKKINAARQSRMKYVSMFMVHEWLIDIPHDLAQNWLVGLRAEGERCLVFSNGGRTTSRNRSGNFIHNRFPSSLPSGNYAQQKKACVTILDCIWIANLRAYYVIDCILWSDQKIGLSDASMRLWFIRSKLSECFNIDRTSKYNKYRFVCINTMDVTVDNLKSLYFGDNDNATKDGGNNEEKNNEQSVAKMQSDGLIFYHKHGSYVQGASCPLILVWKDEKISRWFVDTSNRQNENKQLQFVNLQLRKNGAALTTFEEDVVLGNVSQEMIKKYGFRPDELLRFSITNALMNECKVDNLVYVKRSSKSKMQADTWSKIVFQHQAMNGCSVKFEHILKAVDENDQHKNEDIGVEDDLRVATLGLSSIHL